jgi:hypothetical protein
MKNCLIQTNKRAKPFLGLKMAKLATIFPFLEKQGSRLGNGNSVFYKIKKIFFLLTYSCHNPAVALWYKK